MCFKVLSLRANNDILFCAKIIKFKAELSTAKILCFYYVKYKELLSVHNNKISCIFSYALPSPTIAHINKNSADLLSIIYVRQNSLEITCFGNNNKILISLKSPSSNNLYFINLAKFIDSSNKEQIKYLEPYASSKSIISKTNNPL